MTKEAVQQAMATLQTQGKPISARNVMRILRNQPPKFMGCSFTDLLRYLRSQEVTVDTLLSLREELQTAMDQQQWHMLPQLITQGERAWQAFHAEREAARIRGDSPGTPWIWMDALGLLRESIRQAQWALDARQPAQR
jgi:hypothetical protein